MFFSQFTDHKVKIVSMTYQVEDISGEKEESYLLEVGRCYSKLNFYKAPWDKIEVELDKIDLDIMKKLSTTYPTTSLDLPRSKEE